MPDYGIAAQVAPPNFGQLSTILGIQQQRQALQIGAEQLMSARAKATMDTQAATENQAAATLLRDPVGNGLIDAAGNVTPDAQSIIARTMPTTWTQHYNDIVNAAKTKLDFNTSLNNLNTVERGELAGAYGRGAADQSNSKDDVKDLVQSVVDSKKGTPVYGDYQRLAGIGNQMLDHAAEQPKGAPPETQGNERWRRAALGLNGTILPATAVTGPGGVGTPAIGTATTPSGATVGTAQSRLGGGLTTAGAPITTGVPPTIVTPPGGIPAVMAGRGGAPSPGAATGPTGGPAPTNQDYENFGAYAANLNQRVRIASDSIPRINAAEQALDAIRSGAGTETQMAWARRLQAIGAPKSLVDAVGAGNLAAAQEAEKLLFQTTFSGLRQSMQGDPARVAEFQSAEKVFPSVGTDPRASKAILQFMRDQGQRDFAEQQELTRSRKEGTFNPATWEADYQAKLRAGQVPGAPASQVPNVPAPTGRTATGAELQAYARKHNLTVEAARAHAVQNGFTIRE